MLRRKALLKDNIRSCEPCGQISADIHLGFPLPFTVGREIATRLDLHGADPGRSLRLKYKLKRFIDDVDCGKCCFRSVPVVGRNRRDGVSDETHGIVEEISRIARIAATPGNVARIAANYRTYT